MFDAKGFIHGRALPYVAALFLMAAFLAQGPALGHQTQRQPAARSTLDGPEPARSGDAAWFGLRLPEPETDPATGAFQTARTDLPARPAVFAPGPMDPLFNGAALYADVATIVGFSHESRAAGEYLWGRITGRPAYDKMAEWVAARLRAAGYADTSLEPFRATDINLPVAGEVRLIGGAEMGPGSRDVVLQSAMVQGSGPVNGTVTAPLVYAGMGMDADLAGRDLHGKIAVILAFPAPSLYAPIPAHRTEAAIRAGAVGVVEILVQAGNLKSFDRDRHGCGQGLCFTVGGEDGFFLLNLLGEAARVGRSVNARLSARSETLNKDVSNVVAKLPGKTGRTIIIDAHIDGWFGGADDNASGVAIMLALTKHFANAPKLERTLVFVASAGHHSAGASGLAAFRARHDTGHVAQADLVLNIEHPAQTATMRSYVDQQDDNFGRRMIAASGELPKQIAISNGAPYLIDLWRQGIECFGLDAQRIIDKPLPGELKAFIQWPEIPQTQMIASGEVYHTTGDDLYSVPPGGLERAARFYAHFIAQVANAPTGLLHGDAWTAVRQCPPTP
ncbi:M28 family peptidase [Niveispirillum sp. KHB5.9]|uniref:M28 family peptidase n=1 Tax=Niveispirillum sp. KHB5.9 TaxID=3400269 RepID=UPI003A88A065